MTNISGKNRSNDKFYFPGLQNYCRRWLQPWNETMLVYSLEGKIWQTQTTCSKAQTSLCQQRYVPSKPWFFHVQIWELDHKESWALRNWGFWTMVLEKTLESPLDCKDIKPINPKGNQPWIFIGRTDAKVEAPILWLSHVKSQLIGKDIGAEKDWGQEEVGATEDEMVGWHYWLSGHEYEQISEDSKGRWSLMCCSPWRHHLATEQNQWEREFEAINLTKKKNRILPVVNFYSTTDFQSLYFNISHWYLFHSVIISVWNSILNAEISCIFVVNKDCKIAKDLSLPILHLVLCR